MLACLWVGVSRSSLLVVGVLILFRVGTPTTFFVFVCGVCVWCGVVGVVVEATPNFCV